MTFKVIATGWNCYSFLPNFFASIEHQDVKDFDVCVVDDASDVFNQQEMISQFCERLGWEYILRDEHQGGMKNQYDAIHHLNPNPDDILVFVDLDDALYGDKVFSTLNGYYRNPDLLLTFGSYLPSPRSKTCAPAIDFSPEVVATNSYRKSLVEDGQSFNHLRTMRFGLFDQLSIQDFTWPDGTWFENAQDTAVMIPALELAGGRYRFLQEVLYLYSSQNPLSDWRRAPRTLDRVHHEIISRLPKQPLGELWTI